MKAEHIERMVLENDGICNHCGQTIKIYRYSLNKSLAIFMRAMADAVRNTGANSVDIGTLELPYSVRTQITKLRLHGLVARVKDGTGTQVARHWLITHRGWNFVNGNALPKQVIVFNNQVLGHDGGLVTIHSILGEKFDPKAPQYEATPVTPTESRIYHDVRPPKKRITITARPRGNMEITLKLVLEHLTVGQPVKILSVDGDEAQAFEYKDIAAFQRDWQPV
jgi:hypothetical protein